jgi:hypothetical protein
MRDANDLVTHLGGCPFAVDLHRKAEDFVRLCVEAWLPLVSLNGTLMDAGGAKSALEDLGISNMGVLALESGVLLGTVQVAPRPRSSGPVVWLVLL